MSSAATKRSLRLRASAEAFEILRANGSPKVTNAELLKNAAFGDHVPHPRIVREVHRALLDARAAQPKEQASPLQMISGIFKGFVQSSSPPVDDVLRRFVEAWLRPD